MGSLLCGPAGSLVLGGVRSQGHLRLSGQCPAPAYSISAKPSSTPTWDESLKLGLLSLAFRHLFHREAWSPCRAEARFHTPLRFSRMGAHSLAAG